MERFSPGMNEMLKIDVPSHAFLRKCVEVFIGDNDPTNPLISPIYAEDDIMRQIPKTRIIVGTKDVIYDDSLRLADRLIELGVDVKVTEFEDFIHGS